MVNITNMEIINLFKNEFIVKMNQYARLGIQIHEKNSMTSILKNHKLSKIKDLIFKFQYTVASFFNLMYILFSPHKDLKKSVFLFTDFRHTKKGHNNTQIVRIGLYNFRNFKYPHILDVLTCRDICKICIESFLDYRNIVKDIKKYAKTINQDYKIFFNIINLSYFKYLDILLTIKALEKTHDSYIYFAGHFDIYVSLLSLLRKKGEIGYLCGYQHGLYELPRIPLEYEKFYTDEYILLFQESQKYFMKYLNGNQRCLVKVRSQILLSYLKTFRKNDKNLIVYAMQTDHYDLDIANLSKLEKIYHPNENILMCYVHPATQSDVIKKLCNKFPNILFEASERYNNVDILFTRYSTIGIEYMKMNNTQVYYIKSDDKVCIFYDTKVKTIDL